MTECLKSFINKNKWFLDSRYRRHIIEDKTKFITLIYKDGEHVTIKDDSKRKIVGIYKIGNKYSLIIKDVLLVEGLKHNLLNIIQLYNINLIATFIKNIWIILKDLDCNVYFFFNFRKNNIYTIKFDESILNEYYIITIQEELNQFEQNDI